MGFTASFGCLGTDNMIADIEFSIAHEPVETGIGILERATKDTSPFSDTGNKTLYVPSVQGSIRKSI